MNREAAKQSESREILQVQEAFAQLKEKTGGIHEKSVNEAIAEQVASLYHLLKQVFAEKDVALQTFDTVWPSIRNRDYLLRRADPGSSIEGIFSKNAIELTAPHERFANAADATDEGLKIALTEGHGGSHIVLLYVFSSEGLHIKNISPQKDEIQDRKRFLHIRSVTGTLPIGQIKDIVLRIPTKFFPTEELTTTEEERIEDSISPLPYVYRAARITAEMKEDITPQVKAA